MFDYNATTKKASSKKETKRGASVLGENETTPPGRLRARSGRARRAARAARTRTRGGRGSTRGRRTHAGVSVGRHAGSSCCVNLDLRETCGRVRGMAVSASAGNGAGRTKRSWTRAHRRGHIDVAVRTFRLRTRHRGGRRALARTRVTRRPRFESLFRPCVRSSRLRNL